MARSGKEERSTRKSKKSREASLERRFEDFSEELGELGDRFGRRLELVSEEKRSWSHQTFGILGPLLSSILGLICLVIFEWLLGVAYALSREAVLISMKMFVSNHLGLIFALFLFFSYCSYFSWAYPRAYEVFSPIVNAASIVAGLWFVIQIMAIFLRHENVGLLHQVLEPLEANLWLIFWIVLVVGYLVLLLEGRHPRSTKGRTFVKAARRRNDSGKIRRLYRSSEDKVLGGVCGGIAEYLGVDPVLIRIFLVVAFLVDQIVLPAYIIAWIIIPRNWNGRG